MIGAGEAHMARPIAEPATTGQQQSGTGTPTEMTAVPVDHDHERGQARTSADITYDEGRARQDTNRSAGTCDDPGRRRRRSRSGEGDDRANDQGHEQAAQKRLAPDVGCDEPADPMCVHWGWRGAAPLDPARRDGTPPRRPWPAPWSRCRGGRRRHALGVCESPLTGRAGQPVPARRRDSRPSRS